jgi:hypothetical protein
LVTKYDEYLCHQTIHYFDQPQTSAREWAERLIFHLHDREGEIHHCCGFGLYPNRNVMDAYAVASVEKKTQYGVRASRILRPRYDEVDVGPFVYEVIEPLKKVRYACAENDFDISYDIEFEGVLPCHAEDTQLFMDHGRVVENANRFDQSGKASGWLEVAGRTYELDDNRFMIERDHSWGIRRDQGTIFETGVQPMTIPEGYLYSWGVFQFDGWGCCYHIRELHDGKPILSSASVYSAGSEPEEIRAERIEHDFKFEDNALRKLADGSRVILHLEDGTTRDIRATPLNYCCLKVGGYFGYEGFTHGKWYGGDFVDGVSFDMTDPEKLREASFIDNAGCALECDGKTGYGVIELVVTGKSLQYGYEGY